MLIHVYIIGNGDSDTLNACLKSLWQAASCPTTLQVVVIPSGNETIVESNRRENLRIESNSSLIGTETAHSARQINRCIVAAFGNWSNPVGTDWCVIASANVAWKRDWDTSLEREDRFDLITEAVGPSILAVNCSAVRKIGFLDERFTASYLHLIDFQLRGIIGLVDRISISSETPAIPAAGLSDCQDVNDIAGSFMAASHSKEVCVPKRPTRPIIAESMYGSWNPFNDDLIIPNSRHREITSIPPQVERMMKNLLLHKWQVTDFDLLFDKRRFVEYAVVHPMMPSEVDWYPQFWDKMPGRAHLLLGKYLDVGHPNQSPTVAKRRPLWRRIPKKIVHSLQKRSDRLAGFIHRRIGHVESGAKPSIHHPLNQPARVILTGPVASNENSLAFQKPTSSEERVLAVVQGPFFRRIGYASTFEIVERLKSSPFGSRLKTAVAMWDSESRGDIRQMERLADYVHVLRQPKRRGACHRNWQTYAVASVLAAHERDGYKFAMKCRSDMLITDKFITHAFARAKENSDKLTVTNLFTRYEPFHVSDMLVAARYENLQKYFGDYELYYEDMASPEVEMTRGYIRARGLEYFHTLADYLRFLKDHVDLVDYDEMGLQWMKQLDANPLHWNLARTYLVEKDCGPWQAQLVTRMAHEKLQRMSSSQIRRKALIMQVIDPIWKSLVSRNNPLQKCPYFLFARPEYQYPVKKREHLDQVREATPGKTSAIKAAA